MANENVAARVATLGGLVLILLGAFGLAFLRPLGLHVEVGVTLGHLLAGVAALYMGLNSTSLSRLRVFCLGLGGAVGLVGLAGLLLSEPASRIPLLSGYLALPRLAHIFDLLIGVGLIWAAMIPAPAVCLARTPAAH